MQMLARAEPHFQPKRFHARRKLRTGIFRGIECHFRQKCTPQIALPRRKLRPFAPAIKLASLTLLVRTPLSHAVNENTGFLPPQGEAFGGGRCVPRVYPEEHRWG
jgi:hypothetical protein